MSNFNIEIAAGKSQNERGPEGRGELQFEGPFGPMYVKFVIWKSRDGDRYAKFDGTKRYQANDGSDREFRIASFTNGADSDGFSRACVEALDAFNAAGGRQNRGSGNSQRQGGGRGNGANGNGGGWGQRKSQGGSWGQNSGGQQAGWGQNGNGQGGQSNNNGEDDDPIPF